MWKRKDLREFDIRWNGWGITSTFLFQIHPCCQFHQHFTRGFFVRKFCTQAIGGMVVNFTNILRAAFVPIFLLLGRKTCKNLVKLTPFPLSPLFQPEAKNVKQNIFIPYPWTLPNVLFSLSYCFVLLLLLSKKASTNQHQNYKTTVVKHMPIFPLVTHNYLFYNVISNRQKITF